VTPSDLLVVFAAQQSIECLTICNCLTRSPRAGSATSEAGAMSVSVRSALDTS